VLPECIDAQTWLAYLVGIKSVLGNLSNDLGFIATLRDCTRQIVSLDESEKEMNELDPKIASFPWIWFGAALLAMMVIGTITISFPL
jgi:hypothetical protein